MEADQGGGHGLGAAVGQQAVSAGSPAFAHELLAKATPEECFVGIGLPSEAAKDTTTEQAYQFLGAALRSYCPDKLPILQQPA